MATVAAPLIYIKYQLSWRERARKIKLGAVAFATPALAFGVSEIDAQFISR